MKISSVIFFIAVILSSCQQSKKINTALQPDWSKRKCEVLLGDLNHGKSYLPIYSHIYHQHERRTVELTVTVSIRNTSATDSIYISKADYFNSEGEKVRAYLTSPVYIKPMETLEIIIIEEDDEGGSGANFVFDWAVKNKNNIPLFEAVMISTYGQQGLSFSTRGVQVFE